MVARRRAIHARQAKSLGENGIGHKSLLRLATPGLNGIGNIGF